MINTMDAGRDPHWPRGGWCPALLLLAAPLAGAALELPAELGTPDPATIPWPDDQPATAEQIHLGRLLFADPRLSGDRSVSCASCHDPQRGFADGRRTAAGIGGQRLARNTPGLTNLAWGTLFFWDGRAASLEEQALAPMGNPHEMAMAAGELVPRLSRVAAYRDGFARAYAAGLTERTVLAAIAAYERTLISRDSPFDRFVAGAPDALSAGTRRGLALFSATNCIACHRGPNFTNESFQDIGLRDRSDPGRGAIVPGATLQHAFKTPGLRNVALTAPYFHDGSARTLAEVIAFYDRGGDVPGVNPLIRPLGLTADQREDLVAFLDALTGSLPTTAATPPPEDP